ncbi:MAG: aldo/keto reductase [Hyphomicrobiaceae bacterium]|nr:aldo/keto reductase [Hyphomicrobiaceae bacterium]
MERRSLGLFGPRIAAVGLGCMSIGGTYGATTESDVARLFDTALDLGVDHFDTADIYGMGESEELIGRLMRERRPRLSIATKAGIRFARTTGERYIDNSPTYLRQALEKSLTRLGRDHVDLFYVHRREAGRPVGEVVEALADLKREGKVRAIGLSEVSAETLVAAHAVHRIDAVQNEYSLWTRVPEKGVLAAARQRGIAFVAFSPLGRGMLSGAPPVPSEFTHRDFRRANPRFSGEAYARNAEVAARLASLARDLGRTPAGLALAWVLSRDPSIVAIPGTRSAEHLAENVHGVERPLSESEVLAVAAILPPEFPWGARYAPSQSLGVEDV